MQTLKKATKKSKRLRYIQWAIFLSGLSVFAQLYLFQPLLPRMAKYFEVSIGYSSFLVSGSTIGMALGLFFFAFTADDYSRKRVMVFSLVTSAVLTIISTWVPNLPLLIIIGVLKGFVISGVSAVALAYLSEEVALAAVGIAMSMYLSGNIIGGMSGRVLATILVGYLGWQNTVLCIGLESLVLGLVFWRVLPESRFFVPRKVNFKRKIVKMRGFLRDAYFLRLYVLAALLMGVFVSVYNYLSFRLENPPFSLDHYVIAFIFVMYIFGVLGTMLAGKFTDKYAPRLILRWTILAMLVGAVLLLSTNLYFVIIGLIIVTFSFFAAHTVASRMVAQGAKENKSAATASYWLFYYVGSSLLGSGSGYLLHFTSWYGFVGFLAVATFVSYGLSYKKGERLKIHRLFWETKH